MNRPIDEHGRLGLTTVVIASPARASLLEHARSCPGSECCGLLLGGMQEHRAVVQLVEPSPNVHPGNRAGRYQIDSDLVIRALFDARQGGLDLLGFYHSHPDGSIQPSLTDARAAWPGMIYLIVGQPARDRPGLPRGLPDRGHQPVRGTGHDHALRVGGCALAR